MIFYEVTNGIDNWLVATQAEARAAARQPISGSWSQVDVPTDKHGLMVYINELMSKRPSRDELPTITDDGPSSTSYVPAAVDHKPAYSQAEVNAMFEPTAKTAALTPDDVDQVCMLIAQMRGAAIGHVAHELAARIERLGKEVV